MLLEWHYTISPGKGDKTAYHLRSSFKRVVSDMGLNCRMFYVINSTTNPGQPLVAKGSVGRRLQSRDHLKIIWQPKAAQDLLLNLIDKTFYS